MYLVYGDMREVVWNMNKDMIDRFIYEFNLVSTGSVKDVEELMCRVNNNDIDVDYKNSVSMYDFVNSFNKLYLKFRDDLELLPSLGIDGNIMLGWYDGCKNSKYERLTLFVGEEKIIYIDRINDRYECYIANVISVSDEDFGYEKLNISADVIKKYLEFGNKYDVLIDGYNNFKNKQIFCNGYSMMFTKINGGLFSESNTFEISFGNVSMNYEDYINIVFKLGNNLEIDYDNSMVKLVGTLYDDKSMFIDDCIKRIYINKKNVLFIDEISNSNGMKKRILSKI